jgi:hypothetical protein
MQAQLNPLDFLEPTSISPANSLDPRTIHVWYHPRAAFKNKSL